MCITLCNRFSRFRIIVRTCRIQIQNLPVHNFFRRTNIANSSQKLFPIIATTSFFQPFIVHSKPDSFSFKTNIDRYFVIRSLKKLRFRQFYFLPFSSFFLGGGSLPLRPHFVACYPLCGGHPHNAPDIVTRIRNC